MSTDLYGIRVLETKPEENKLVIKVFVVYYDLASKHHKHQPLPKDPSFFLRILWDEGDARFGKGGSIGVEISVNQICDETWVDRNTFRFIKNIEQLATANFPLKHGVDYSDFYYERNGSWADEDKLVQATYEVEVTDSKYFDHLSTGMSWGTTSYQTKSTKVSLDHLSHLPNITKPVIQLHPFKGKEEKAGTIVDVLFSKDSTYFFVLSSAGELVSYRTDKWEEIWRKDAQQSSPEKLECDHTKKLIWAEGYEPSDKVVFNFEGTIVKEKIWPDTRAQSNTFHLSPSGNYFVLHPSTMEEAVTVYDTQGNLLWEYSGINDEERRQAFFPKEDKLLVLVLSLDILKVFDLKTGKELTTVDYSSENCGYHLSVDPTGQFFSYDEIGYARSGFVFTTKIVEFEHLETIFEYGPNNGDKLSSCIWSPDNQFAAIITKGKGTRHNSHYGGNVTIYPIGIEDLQ